MRTAVGIFACVDDAERATRDMVGAGVAAEHITILTPETTRATLARVPTEDGEQPGMGAAVGGLLGGAVGASGGAWLVPVTVTALPIVAPALGSLGVVATVVFGVAGAAGGAAAGGRLESLLSNGLPKDEMFFYEDGLRRGRTVVVAFAENGDELDLCRRLLGAARAESLDAARERWWIGLGDVREVTSGLSDGDGALVEALFRRGMEAALRPENRGRSFQAARGSLRGEEGSTTHAYRYGYERGQAYYRDLVGRHDEAQRLAR
jgi:hypothetical protein